MCCFKLCEYLTTRFFVAVIANQINACVGRRYAAHGVCSQSRGLSVLFSYFPTMVGDGVRRRAADNMTRRRRHDKHAARAAGGRRAVASMRSGRNLLKIDAR